MEEEVFFHPVYDTPAVSATPGAQVKPSPLEPEQRVCVCVSTCRVCMQACIIVFLGDFERVIVVFFSFLLVWALIFATNVVIQ